MRFWKVVPVISSSWRDARDEEIDRLRAKVGEITMDNELLYEKIAKMEGVHSFARRRSKR